jgi:hypothetical protein
MEMMRDSGRPIPASMPDSVSAYGRMWQRGNAVFSVTAIDWTDPYFASGYLAGTIQTFPEGAVTELAGVPDGTFAALVEPATGQPMEMAIFRRGPVVYLLVGVNLAPDQLRILATQQSARAGEGTTSPALLPDLRRLALYAAVGLLLLAATVVGAIFLGRALAAKAQRRGSVAVLSSSGWSTQLPS